MSLAHDRVARWLQGRAGVSADGEVVLGERRGVALVHKLARAYDWIATQVLITPYDDMEFGAARSVGRGGAVALHAGQRWCSFILLPLLTLVTGQRLLIIGGPGRGKTSIAMLMAMLVGDPPAEVRRMVQRGHPQLTVADLLGSPLPSELIRAQSADAVRVAWRRWLTQRVKVIDEYNRIPTKTQSALLSLMAEGCAEMFEQVVEVGPSSWYLTANDDLGGGTFEVIEALRDRIDAVVRCPPYSGRLLDTLAARVGDGAPRALDDLAPRDLVLSLAELARIATEVRALAVPEDVLDAVGFFAGQLDFCGRASPRVEYKNKDTLHIAGRRVAHVCNEDCPLDKQQNLCSQSESGVSARAYQSLLLLAKALAWFRGEPAVSIEDVRALLPWVLHDKLRINPQSAFFTRPEHRVYLTDRVSWIHQMFDAAMAQRAAYAKLRAPVDGLRREVAGLGSRGDDEVTQAMERVRRAMEKLVEQGELTAPVHADLLVLKGLHARCQRLLDDRRRPSWSA
ncbi:MAG TPA: MoxR family ATPase [Kofleriaceae bacterium]|jgi:MoxR-like ATPase|nr:MoxR family ATPase [Kofleriaceae bacterium]